MNPISPSAKDPSWLRNHKQPLQTASLIALLISPLLLYIGLQNHLEILSFVAFGLMAAALGLVIILG